MEQYKQTDESLKSKGFWEKLKENTNKVLKIGVTPILFTAFMASCEDSEKSLSQETLRGLESNPSIEKIDATSLEEMKDIVEEAKKQGKETFRIESEDGKIITLDVDTTSGAIKYEESIGAGTDDYKSAEYEYRTVANPERTYFGYSAYGSAGEGRTIGGLHSMISYDKKTTIAVSAIVDRGVNNEAYFIDTDGKIVGDKGVVKDAEDDFKKGIELSKEVINK